jgi:hypothetical protein
MEKTLKQKIKEALSLPDSHFGSHQSDLYIKSSEAVIVWLKNHYEFYRSVETFTSEMDKSPWLCVPFGYMVEHYNKKFHVNLNELK